MIAFIDDQRASYGVEPICREPPIAPSTYHAKIALRRRDPWRGIEPVELATIERVDWFNHRRILEPIGNIPPAEAEARFYAEPETRAVAAQDSNETCLPETRRGSR